MKVVHILTYTSISLEQILIHRSFWLRLFLQGFLPIIIPALVWKSVFTELDIESYKGFDQIKLNTYYVLVGIIVILSQTNIHMEFSKLIHEGTLSNLLLKPISIASIITSIVAARLSILLIPAIFGSLSIYLLSPSIIVKDWVAPFIFFSVTPGAVLIVILAGILIGLSSFWFIHVEGIYFGLYTILGFLGGSIVPLALLPEYFVKIEKLSPFIFSFNYPIIAVINKDISSVSFIVFGQGIWILFLLFLIRILWIKGLKKYDSVGG